MVSPTFRVLLVFLVGLMSGVGCNRSDTAALNQAKADAEAARAEARAAKEELGKLRARIDADAKGNPPSPQPNSAERERRTAEWVLNVQGAVRVVVDGVPHYIKKGGQIPAGEMKLIEISLNRADKATDDGIEYMRRLQGLSNVRNFSVGSGSGLRSYEFLADMQNLEELEFVIARDQDLVHLKGLTKLKNLYLGSEASLPHAGVTSAGLEPLKGLKQLKRLYLDHLTTIDDAGLQHLKGLSALEQLGLRYTKVTNVGLEHLKGLSNLDMLHLHGTKVTDDGVKSLQAALPKCRISR